MKYSVPDHRIISALTLADANQVPWHRPRSQQRGPETLDHPDQRIHRIEVAKALGNQAGGIDHRRRIHQKLNGKRQTRT